MIRRGDYVSFRFAFSIRSINRSRCNTNWSFEPDLHALAFVDIGCRRMAEKGGVADGENVAVGIEKADDIESWTS